MRKRVFHSHIYSIVVWNQFCSTPPTYSQSATKSYVTFANELTAVYCDQGPVRIICSDLKAISATAGRHAYISDLHSKDTLRQSGMMSACTYEYMRINAYILWSSDEANWKLLAA